MDVSLLRAVANVPMSAAVVWAAFAVAWTIGEPDWAVIKTIFVAPFILVPVSLVFLILHGVAALVAMIAMRFGAPGRAVALLAALLLALPFLKLSGDPQFGDPMTVNVGLVLAAVIPWMLARPLLWPWRLAT